MEKSLGAASVLNLSESMEHPSRCRSDDFNERSISVR